MNMNLISQIILRWTFEIKYDYLYDIEINKWISIKIYLQARTQPSRFISFFIFFLCFGVLLFGAVLLFLFEPLRFIINFGEVSNSFEDISLQEYKDPDYKCNSYKKESNDISSKLLILTFSLYPLNFQ